MPSQNSYDVQIVIPMAGLGSRFQEAGFRKIKPFIDVAGKAMITRVVENLAVDGARFVFIARGEHRSAIENELEPCLDGVAHEVVYIDGVTEGAACTVLCAARSLDPSRPMLIANSDQIVDVSISEYLDDAIGRQLDGSILTFSCPGGDTKWSYARQRADGLVDLVREKEAISEQATVGIYWFARAGDFVTNAVDMIARNERVNGEFYVCPVYQWAIATGARIGVYEIPPSAMHGIGTPRDLEVFLAHLGQDTHAG